jgi:putative ABC transport system substrate-binding protein
MRRRDFLRRSVAGAALLVFRAAPAQSGAVPRIAFLGNSTAKLEANLVEPFRQGLRELGYIEGQTIHIDYRWAEGDYSRFPLLIRELVALNPAIIVTAGTPAAKAVAYATKTIPCVMVAVGDPVGTGLIRSLAHPAGNLTGLSSVAPELEGKRLALLREVVPKLSRVAVFWNPDNPFHVISKQQVHEAAEVLGINVRFLAVRAATDIEPALASVKSEKPEALVILADRVFLHDRARLMEFAQEYHFPGVYTYRELVEAGGLMSYGPNYAHLHERAAHFVNKILKGAKPGDLPVEAPTRFDLVLNLRTAKALNLTIPPTLLARADEVIE